MLLRITAASAAAVAVGGVLVVALTTSTTGRPTGTWPPSWGAPSAGPPAAGAPGHRPPTSPIGHAPGDHGTDSAWTTGTPPVRTQSFTNNNPDPGPRNPKPVNPEALLASVRRLCG